MCDHAKTIERQQRAQIDTYHEARRGRIIPGTRSGLPWLGGGTIKSSIDNESNRYAFNFLETSPARIADRMMIFNHFRYERDMEISMFLLSGAMPDDIHLVEFVSDQEWLNPFKLKYRIT